MCQAGVPPSPATFANLVSALRQQQSGEAEVAELVAGLAEQAEGLGTPGQATQVCCRKLLLRRSLLALCW